jgi:hypothetical protein
MVFCSESECDGVCDIASLSVVARSVLFELDVDIRELVLTISPLQAVSILADGGHGRARFGHALTWTEQVDGQGGRFLGRSCSEGVGRLSI